MSKIIILIVFLSLFSAASAENWAVLVAGSNSWFNYRHQADVFHAYKMFLAKNFNKERIIVMAYNDIANNSRNPFPGKVFNKPTYSDPGVDVYEGVNIDYQGADVTPENFLKVLSGQKNEMVGVGSGKVVPANEKNQIFIFFSDHGAPNLIAFPSKYLYADQLLATFSTMKYDKIAFYLEVSYFSN